MLGKRSAIFWNTMTDAYEARRNPVKSVYPAAFMSFSYCFSAVFFNAMVSDATWMIPSALPPRALIRRQARSHSARS